MGLLRLLVTLLLLLSEFLADYVDCYIKINSTVIQGEILINTIMYICMQIACKMSDLYILCLCLTLRALTFLMDEDCTEKYFEYRQLYVRPGIDIY